ncbi:MAG: FHA domain-containing protein [Lentisphaeria bacterium]|nr:FHA domain-containing protein [Lentisphaeria bacterium]
MSKLICIKGLNYGDQFTLHEGRNSIGRSPDASVVLFDKQSSRENCVIVKKGHHYSIQDLESRNGTYLNKKRLGKKPLSLKSGDKIKIGKTVLQLSEKAVGGLIDQTATDAAADLQGQEFKKLINTASASVVKNDHEHHADSTVSSLKNIFRRLFKK